MGYSNVGKYLGQKQKNTSKLCCIFEVFENLRLGADRYIAGEWTLQGLLRDFEQKKTFMPSSSLSLNIKILFEGAKVLGRDKQPLDGLVLF